VRILAIDAATPTLLLAFVDGGTTSAEAHELGRTHSTALLPKVAALLAGRRPDAVAVAAGPGSYTGIRIGMATAEGLARGFAIPAVAVPTFVAWALPYAGAPSVVTAIDARGGRLFAARFAYGQEVLATDLYPAEAILPLAANSLVVTVEETLLPHRAWRRPTAVGLAEAAQSALGEGRLPPFAPQYVRPAAVDRKD
jgi:tRNA threonylcarbamoyladenosine biosynthesis protein TsaB